MNKTIPISWMLNEYTLDDLVNDAANELQIPVDVLKSKTKKREVVEVRQVVMHIARRFKIAKTYYAIGKAFGQDHSTAVHAIKQIEDLKQTNTRVKTIYARIHGRVHHTFMGLQHGKLFERWALNIPQL